MVSKRVMPCLLLDEGALVKTVRFKNPRYVGDPINAIKIFNEKEVDELLMLDIRASRKERPPAFELIRACASECFMPFTYGGGVRTLEHFETLYRHGVEKVAVNAQCLAEPELVRQAVRAFGSTSVVGAVDFTRSRFRGLRVFSASGHRTHRPLVDHCRFLADDLGVGEILLYAADRDGTWTGFDLPAIRQVADAISVPLIACGGAGSIDDVHAVLHETPANAAAIGSMAVYQKQGMGVLINFPQRAQILEEACAA